MTNRNFGDFLHEARLRRGLTQYQLGALVGVSDKAVSKWETGLSKPQIGILYQIGEALGVSVDELLSCKYRSVEKQSSKGPFATKKQLWKKAYDTMRERYGDPVPIAISDRFFAEQAELQHTDLIVYFDLLATLSAKAKQRNKQIRLSGWAGTSLVAYLLGATNVNPLPPHFFCPNCHAVLFDSSVKDGWDLPAQSCSCGTMTVGDGHDIPFESFRHVAQRHPSFAISLSPEFFDTAKSLLEYYFKDCVTTVTEREDHRATSWTVSSQHSDCTISLCANPAFASYEALEAATATSFERVRFANPEILAEFQKGNVEGIPEFGSEFIKQLLHTTCPSSFHDLLQLLGFAHGSGTWQNNAAQLHRQGVPVGRLIAYRDDVFCRVREAALARGISGLGLSYKIMEDTRRGIYAKNGLPADLREQLQLLGVEEWFPDSVEKIKYLFPKAHGVTHARIAATLMWYKIHYPKEFQEIFSCKLRRGHL
ncbi:MAG: helix-turn-helix domain-containing protein [Clostridia bacterium]|nr:helix-turn-helix domain-containing protein [Clostridia bacterium]